MKRIGKILVSLMALTSPAFADLCSDLTNNYAQRMMQLQNDTNAALSQTTDPAEQAAIRQSFQMQVAQLEAEKEAALTSAGCNTPTPPPPPPTDPGTPPTDPGTPPTDPGTPPTDPGTTPTDPGTPPTDPGTPPTDPGTPPTDPGTTPTPPGSNCPPNNCFQELKDYAEQLKCQGFRGRDLMDRVKMKANELGCGFGYGRGSNPHHGYKKHHGDSNCRHGQRRDRCGQRRPNRDRCDD